MLTRKHFEHAADWLAWERAEGRDIDAARRLVVTLFSADNPRFDVNRFDARIAERFAQYTEGRVTC